MTYILKTKLLKRLMLLALLISVSGCLSMSSGNKGYCLIASPINPTEADIEVISDDLVDDLLVHNEIYDRLCE